MPTLTTKSPWNPPGKRPSRLKATSGPSNAPALSKARCTPKASARLERGLLSAIKVSRGAVRMPLPSRSSNRQAVRWQPSPLDHQESQLASG